MTLSLCLSKLCYIAKPVQQHLSLGRLLWMAMHVGLTQAKDLWGEGSQ